MFRFAVVALLVAAVAAAPKAKPSLGHVSYGYSVLPTAVSHQSRIDIETSPVVSPIAIKSTNVGAAYSESVVVDSEGTHVVNKPVYIATPVHKTVKTLPSVTTYSHPVVTQEVVQQQYVQQPILTKVVSQPVVSQVVHQPVVSQHIVSQPVVSQRVSERVVSERVVSQQPSVSHYVSQPVVEQRVSQYVSQPVSQYVSSPVVRTVGISSPVVVSKNVVVHPHTSYGYVV